jgi:hypothetical protein
VLDYAGGFVESTHSRYPGAFVAWCQRASVSCHLACLRAPGGMELEQFGDEHAHGRWQSHHLVWGVARPELNLWVSWSRLGVFRD